MEDVNDRGVIVVGCGKWGTNIINTVHEMRRLAAVVDVDPSKIKLLKERFPTMGERFYVCPGGNEGLEYALNGHTQAAVVVATPPASHFKLAMSALSHGRHVFIEKPICDSPKDAQTLISQASKRGCVLMVDHLLQYSLPHRRLIHLVSTGYVGDVRRVRMRRVNFGTIRTVEDVLWSFCPHDLSILLSLLRGASSSSSLSYGNNKIHATSVACHGQITVSDHISDYVDIFINFSSGARVHVEASWLHPLKERQVVVYGSRGSIILNEAVPDHTVPKIQMFKWTTKRKADGTAVDAKISQEEIENYLADHPEHDFVSHVSDSPLRCAFDHFFHCIENKKTPRTDGEEALRVLTLLNAASESMKNDGSIIAIEHGGQHSTKKVQSNGISMPSSSAKVEVAGAEYERNVNKSRSYFVHDSAVVDNGATILEGTKIWHFCHVMRGASIGKMCNIGQNVFIGGKATLGNGVKVQNNVSIYDAVHIEDDVFLGPSCVLTNVKTPRSHISRKHEFMTTHLKKGVTVGANATIICGVTVNEYAFVGAGAVVTKDVPAHALVYGNPASVQGWVSTTGAKLITDFEKKDKNILKCPETDETYQLQQSADGKDYISPC